MEPEGSKGCLIIDGAYLILGVKELVKSQNYQSINLADSDIINNLKRIISEKFGIESFVNLKFITAEHPHQRKRNQGIYNAFNRNSFFTEVRPYKLRNVTCPRCSNNFKDTVQAEVDIAIATSIFENVYTNNVNKVVLLAGDRDFKDVLVHLSHKKVMVYLVGFEFNMSCEIIPFSEKHLHLDDVWEDLCQKPKSSPKLKDQRNRQQRIQGKNKQFENSQAFRISADLGKSPEIKEELEPACEMEVNSGNLLTKSLEFQNIQGIEEHKKVINFDQRQTYNIASQHNLQYEENVAPDLFTFFQNPVVCEAVIQQDAVINLNPTLQEGSQVFAKFTTEENYPTDYDANIVGGNANFDWKQYSDENINEDTDPAKQESSFENEMTSPLVWGNHGDVGNFNGRMHEQRDMAQRQGMGEQIERFDPPVITAVDNIYELNKITKRRIIDKFVNMDFPEQYVNEAISKVGILDDELILKYLINKMGKK